MEHAFFSMLLSLGIVAGILVCVEIGYRVAARRIAREKLENDDADSEPALGAIDSAVFGLMGLIIAFTFSGALSRWDDRRMQVIDEANAIETAWLRIDLLQPDSQAAMQDLFRQYLDGRIEAYRNAQDLEVRNLHLDRVAEVRARIWGLANSEARSGASTSATMLMLPALNQMFDIASLRLAMSTRHPPKVVFGMLFALILVSALVTGDAMGRTRRRRWAQVLAFAIVLAGTVYVILDLEYPRLGLVRIEDIDRLLVDLRLFMK